MELTVLEQERYKKHLQLNNIGEEGQLRLKQARVIVIGAGGLGSPVLMYLAAAGIGHLTIVDDDVVTLSNLQRQVLHTTPLIGTAKVASAKERLQQLNPEIDLISMPQRLSEANAVKIIQGHHLVVDCTDNLQTRLLINECCFSLSIPFVYGAVYEYEGQVSVFDATRGPCFRCMLPEVLSPDTIPDPEVHGLLGVIPGIVGLMQATEVIKLVTGVGEILIGKLAYFDALSTSLTKINIEKRKNCPVCGD